jgi:hypothetical protein
VPGPEQGGGQFLVAADAELVEYGPEVLLDGVLADGQLADDLPGGISPQDQGHHLGLGTRDAVAVQEQGCDLAGAGLLEQQHSGLAAGAVQPRGVDRQPVPADGAQPDGGRRVPLAGAVALNDS